jgi:rare lipoprotein A
VFAGCASRPPRAGGRDGPDGPEKRPPPGLEQVPDAEPRIEPLRPGGPNKPYEALGQRYVPLLADLPLAEVGLASWYGRKFNGQATASGEPYDMYAMTAAHRTMPIPSYARVRNPANGREVVVRINDRGPFAAGRVIDLSYTAALKLGVLGGVAPVEVQRLTFNDIRSGNWRGASVAAQQRPPSPARPAAAAALAPDDPAPGERPAGLFAAPGFWLQLGAFRSRDDALALQQRVLLEAERLPDAVAVLEDGALYRVQAGPYADRQQAQQAGERWQHELGLTLRVIEKR